MTGIASALNTLTLAIVYGYSGPLVGLEYLGDLSITMTLVELCFAARGGIDEA